MYARITNMAVYPERIEEMLGRLNEVEAAIAQIPGLKHWFATSDKESGNAVAIGIYDSKDSADASASTAQELLAGFGEFFLKPPEVNEYEVDGHLSNP